MDLLSVVGTNPEGDGIVLADAAGHEYTLPIDAALRAAIRGDRPALERARSADELRPREIQALIRAGASVADVATDHSLTPEHVERFAAPVLDERAFVAERAREIPVTNDDDAPALGDMVVNRLALRQIAASEVTWDAWRGPEGWIVSATFPDGLVFVTATWRVDVTGREVTPVDDEAMALSQLELPDTPIPRRLRVVETPLFDFASISPADLPAQPEASPDDEAGDTVTLLEELSEQRGVRLELELDLGDLDGRSDGQDAVAPDEPDDAGEVVPMRSSGRRRARGSSARGSSPQAHDPSASADEGSDETGVHPSRSSRRTTSHRAAGSTSSHDDTPDDHGEEGPGTDDEGEQTRSTSRSKRAKVPSWNEIVFGTTPQD